MSGVWLLLPVLGPVRVSTVVTAVLMFAIVTAVRRDPLRAVVAVVAWTSVFETIYHLVGIVGFQWPASNFAWATAAVAGWVILAAVLGIWPEWRLVALLVVLMAAWIGTGFHYNVPGQTGPIDVRGEVLNEASKTTLALAYLIGALRAKDEHEEDVVHQRRSATAAGRRMSIHRVAAGPGYREGSAGPGDAPVHRRAGSGVAENANDVAADLTRS